MCAQRAPQSADAIRLPADQRALQAELREAFDPERPTRWQGGFALVETLGAVALPVVTEVLSQNDPNVRTQLLRLAALAAIGGRDADAELLATFARRDVGPRERFLAAFVLACGPVCAGPAPELDRALARSGQEPILEAALLLACWRFPGTADPAHQERLFESKEPALAAAARLLRPPTAFREERREHAALVQRAEFLGSPPRALTGDDIARLTSLLSGTDPAEQPLRLAAASWLSQAPDPHTARSQLQSIRLEPESLAILALAPAWREELGPQLRPPTEQIDPIWRGRVALAFVLGASPTEIASARFGRDHGVQAVAWLGVALRLAHSNQRDVPDWCAGLPDHPAREWLFVACGRAPRARAGGIGVPALDLLLGAYDDARLRAIERTTILDLTEDALLQLGAHPSCARRQLELELLRDLLIAGSNRVAPLLGLPEDKRERYLPRGLPPTDTAFEVAYELWRFLSTRVPPPRGARRPY